MKEGFRKYCETAYSRSGFNQMWILKNSKTLLENLESKSLKSVPSIKSYDFSTLYTTIPHSKLKSCLKDLIISSFLGKNGKRRYKYLVINDKMNSTYFVKDHSDCTKKYTEDDNLNMFNFLIDHILTLVDKYFNSLSTSQWAQIVLLLLADLI